ncbi:MAG: CehA/McbA family metallohydrolase [Gemmatimonadetes bacterium]|nr:CehA/McbA family metallohydrolase [Gemmatimonadota bacterium]
MRLFSQVLGRVIPVVLLIASCTDGRAPQATIQFEVPADQDGLWYKGNTHAHTTMSDGDSPPEYVARWYKEHGYDFLVLSDHNVFTDPQSLSHLVDSTFLLIPGEELTSSFEAAAVHVNGLNIPYVLEAQTSSTLVGTIQANVDAVREVEGVPHINHPNFRWSFGAKELAQIERDRLLEISNGHPAVHNEGGEDSPGLEEIWDILLSNGKRIYGIAVDDAHHFQGEFAPDRANPGRGWVTVRAQNLDAMALMEALEAGHFYSSTGVELSDILITRDRLEVYIQRESDFRYTTMFIGEGGQILSESIENPAIFELVTNVGYVRARVRDSAGRVAWTQPVFVIEH